MALFDKEAGPWEIFKKNGGRSRSRPASCDDLKPPSNCWGHENFGVTGLVAAEKHMCCKSLTLAGINIKKVKHSNVE